MEPKQLIRGTFWVKLSPFGNWGHIFLRGLPYGKWFLFGKRHHFRTRKGVILWTWKWLHFGSLIFFSVDTHLNLSNWLILHVNRATTNMIIIIRKTLSYKRTAWRNNHMALWYWYNSKPYTVRLMTNPRARFSEICPWCQLYMITYIFPCIMCCSRLSY